MKLPISKRLQTCAALVPCGARVADVGADHGYLGIHLLLEGVAASVLATDIRPKPLAKARSNAEQFGLAEKMTFLCTDGLIGVDPASVDTVVMAGMGSDTIIGILKAAPWLWDPRYTLILSPQASGQDLRALLYRSGFRIDKDVLCRDGGFFYTVLSARFSGEIREPTPGEQFLSPELRSGGCPELMEYAERLIASMDKTISGMLSGSAPPEKLRFYQQAREELRIWLFSCRESL